MSVSSPFKENPILTQIPAYLFWKNKNSIFLVCNDKFAHIAGLKSPQDIVGKSDYDLPWGKNEANIYRKDDAIILLGLKKLNYIETQLQADGTTKKIITSKTPLFNEKKEIIGVLGIFYDSLYQADFTRQHSQFLPLEIEEGKQDLFSVLGKISSKNIMTRREIECLSLWLYGLSIKEAAKILNTSYRTIVGYRNNIRYKLDINSRRQLTELTHSKELFFLFLHFAKKTIKKYNRILL